MRRFKLLATKQHLRRSKPLLLVLGTVCGGGRYDGLVEQLGVYAAPSIRFAMGLERLVLLVQVNQMFLLKCGGYL